MYVYDEYDQRIIEDRVKQFRDQTRRYLAGELSEEEFRPLRLQNGLYVQRFAPMLRVAVPYGQLTSRQTRMMAKIARDFDKGYAHISTRQNVQFNWPALEDVPDILAELATVQMHAIQTSGNCLRNVTTDQFAGVAADELIDIWGADHSGTVKRIKAAVAALTEGKTKFDVKLVQMVRLLRNGEPEKMSKRSGNFVTIADMVEEVGKDAVRFTMLTRKADAQMDFDFGKVTEASRDNPVFYVQYAHARIQSTLRKAADEGILPSDTHLDRLETEEFDLVKMMAQFPRIVESAAAAREPHRVAFYLNDLAAAFHGHYNLGNDRPDKRILMVNEVETTSARLFLVKNLGQTIRNGLALMGVEAVDSM